MKPKYSIIVPAYNEEALIGDCLISLKNQNFDRKQYEIIVVDNGSSDQTAKITKSFGVRVVKEPQKGVARARIRGAEVAKGEILVYTDADCRPLMNWLRLIDNAFQANPQLDGVGGVFAFFDGNWFETNLTPIGKIFTWHLSGGNMAVKKETYQRLGGFNYRVNLGEDALFSMKLKKYGQFKINRKNLVYTSARRFSYNLPYTLYMYTLNDLFVVLTGKPFFYNFPDIRKGVDGFPVKLEDYFHHKIHNRPALFLTTLTPFVFISALYFTTPSFAQARDINFVKYKLGTIQRTIQQVNFALNQKIPHIKITPK